MVRPSSALLLVATIAVAAVARPSLASDPATSGGECLAPAAVGQYETQIGALEAKNAQWEKQLVAASAKFQEDLAAVESRVGDEQQKHRETAERLAVAEREAAATIDGLREQLTATATEHASALADLREQIATLEKTIEDLKRRLAEKTATLAERTSEATAAKAKLGEVSAQVKTLERDVAASRKKNAALRDELAKMDEKLSISSLLSSYYDEGVIVATTAVEKLRAQLTRTQKQTTGIQQALDTLEAYKASLCETTDKLYKEHLAATVDPMLVELERATAPYVKTYKPLVDAEVKKATRSAERAYKLAVKRFIAARAEAVTVLKQNPTVAPYAPTIVDSVLGLVAIPMVIMLVRLVVRVILWLLYTALCVATCGLCCGKCARKRTKKVNRKASRKQLPSPTTTPTMTAKKQPSSAHAPVSTSRRGSGKKKN